MKAVIFDIDNTLYSFDRANEAALQVLDQYAVNTYGWAKGAMRDAYKRNRSAQFSRYGNNSTAFHRAIRFEMVLKEAGILDYGEVLTLYNLYWDTLLASMEPSEGLLETFQGLKAKGITIGICSDMTILVQLKKLKLLGVLSLADFIVCSEEAGVNKPGEKILSLCCEKAGCDPQDCLFIGDNLPKDVYGPLRYGMQARWFCPEGEPSPQEAPLAIRSLTQILSL